jgi:heat shock protein HslJ
MKWKSVLLIIVLSLFTTLLLASCKPEQEQKRDALDGTNWTLYAYRKTKPIEGTTITAAFSEGQITGSAGCNAFSASYQIEGNQITIISPLAMTVMSCLTPEGVMEQESFISESLLEAERFSLNGDNLILIRPDGETLTFMPIQEE